MIQFSQIEFILSTKCQKSIGSVANLRFSARFIFYLKAFFFAKVLAEVISTWLNDIALLEGQKVFS